MALINCPECNTQVSSAAPSCPKCGFPVAQHAGPAEGATPKPYLTEARAEKPKKPTWRRIASAVPPALLGLVVIYVLVVLTLNRCHEDRSEATATYPPPPSSSSTGETPEGQRETQEAQRCDRYKREIRPAMPADVLNGDVTGAMPDVFNGEVRLEIECNVNTSVITIRVLGDAPRQPHADVVLAATVRGLVDRGINPRRDEVSLILTIYQASKTVTGAAGGRLLTAATYSIVTDSVTDQTGRR